MPDILLIIENVRNIMRQDRGVSADAQRLEQLSWMSFLKILDEKDQELELILFIDLPTDKPFAHLQNLQSSKASQPPRKAPAKPPFSNGREYQQAQSDTFWALFEPSGQKETPVPIRPLRRRKDFRGVRSQPSALFSRSQMLFPKPEPTALQA